MSYWQVLAVDLDRDGRDDILASSLDSQGITAWRNLGNKGWKLFQDAFPSSGIYYELAAADLDRDHITDICAANYGDGLKIWPGKDKQFNIIPRQIEQIEQSDTSIDAAAITENDVFKMENGVAEYKIDTGDTLEITFWEGTTPQKEEIIVRPNGMISFGFVEDLSVGGLTSTQLDERLTAYLKKYEKKPRIDVVVKEFDSKFVQVMGAIKTNANRSGTGPGKYRLKGKTTVLEMLSQAGGPTKDANLNDVRVRRNNGQMITLNIFKTINQGDLSQDLVLNAGDVLFVPSLAEDGNRVYVFGEVEKPGAYTFSGTQFRLFDAISEAGGATVFASTADTRVVRGDPTHPEFINANLKSLIEEGDQTQNMVLASGDLIYVPRSGWGDINILNKRIRPLFELIWWPARAIIDWYHAGDIINSGSTNY
jgi:protein involved in polysaccharide export with SLBB domain